MQNLKVYTDQSNRWPKSNWNKIYLALIPKRIVILNDFDVKGWPNSGFAGLASEKLEMHGLYEKWVPCRMSASVHTGTFIVSSVAHQSDDVILKMCPRTVGPCAQCTVIQKTIWKGKKLEKWTKKNRSWYKQMKNTRSGC